MYQCDKLLITVKILNKLHWCVSSCGEGVVLDPSFSGASLEAADVWQESDVVDFLTLLISPSVVLLLCNKRLLLLFIKSLILYETLFCIN